MIQLLLHAMSWDCRLPSLFYSFHLELHAMLTPCSQCRLAGYPKRTAPEVSAAFVFLWETTERCSARDVSALLLGMRQGGLTSVLLSLSKLLGLEPNKP